MNRLIHKSWGEGFVNIFLDLFNKYFSERGGTLVKKSPRITR